MDSTQRESLLKTARSAVAAHLAGLTPVAPESRPDSAVAVAGVFVSVYVREELRGCTGVLDDRQEIGRAVAQCAVAAATSDPRFSPLTGDELTTAAFEISVLDAPVPMRKPSALEIGRHGILVTSGLRRGVLLPRVPVDLGMSVEEFLDAGCLKAGLAPGGWRTAAVTVELFTAEVFSDVLDAGAAAGAIPNRPGPRD